MIGVETGFDGAQSRNRFGQKFCDAKLVDKLTFIVAPLVIGGHNAPVAIGGEGAQVLASAMRLKNVKIKLHGEDFEVTGYPRTMDE